MNDNYKKLYPVNEKNGNVIIEVSLNDYVEFFHEWDNAVFKKRDIHPELVDFLDLCSDEIPFSQKIEVRFFITDEDADKDKEQLLRASYKNHYNALYFNEKKNVKRIVSSSGFLMAVSLLLLFFYTKLSGTILETTMTAVLLESLLIGGWVLTWEAFHGITIDVAQPLRRCKDIKRLLNSDISFRYTEN